MKYRSRVFAGLAGLAVMLSPTGAFAAPSDGEDTTTKPVPQELLAALTGPTTTNNEGEVLSGAEVPAKQKVMVMVTGQPQGPGNELARISEVNDLIDAWKDKYELEPDRKFGYLVKGFSAYIPTDKIDQLRSEPRVQSVQPVRMYYPVMETAGELTQSVQARATEGVDGAGTVVSIIDTGIDIEHQDMRLDDGAPQKIKPEPGFTAKVPYGFNYADENTTVKDLTASQHGMHVAGIVGANGGAEADAVRNGRINGIAPNAQLLAMKVFSNDPAKGRGAAGDDIIAAIEDSVRLGADVINMSLGSTNGLVADESGEQRAIKNAVAAGVEVIVAAGNEGLSSSPTGVTTDFYPMLDDGTVGSPSTGSYALSVASVNNSSMLQTQATVTIDGAEDGAVYNLQAGESDGQPHRLIYAGLGKPEQVPAEVSGNYALISRGEITFADKVKNAVARGAVGVVIFNNTGSTEIAGMGGLDGATVPVAGMGRTDGQRLRDAIEAGQEVTIALTGGRVIVPNPNGLQPSDFTSWGSTSDLSFKPQLAGIGGSVYSTLNDNQYGTMSGTSMAAPHVAGVAALMREHLSQRYPDLSSTELNDRIRIALANTAKVLTNDAGVPISPRQMGAGLVQTKDAMDTSVYATVDGSPWVELKDFTAAQSRTVTLSNAGDKDATFTVGTTCVVAESNGNGQPITTSCSTTDSVTLSANTVTVPAGGQADVTFTATPGADPHWFSGWVKFESQTDAQPSLSLPYLGFAGDWNAEPIVDTPIYSADSSFYADLLGADNSTVTTLNTTIGSRSIPMAPGATVISPNGDGLKDEVFPSLALLRNARSISVEVIDASGQPVRKLGSERNVSRPTLADLLENPEANLAYSMSSNGFDGTVWNPQKAEFENVPDGTYLMRVNAQLADRWEPQTTDMEFTIDTVAPSLTVTSQSSADDTGTIEVEVSDAVGLNPGTAVLALTDTSSFLTAQPVDGEAGKYRISVPDVDSVRYVTLMAIDKAGNTTSEIVYFNAAAMVVPTAEALNNRVINDQSTSSVTGQPFITDDQLTITGTVRGDVTEVRTGDSVAAVEDAAFTLKVPVVDGDNSFTVEALNGAGEVVDSVTFSFTRDNQAPVIELTAPAQSNGVAELNADGSLTISGTVTDDHAQIRRVMIAGTVVPVQNGSFTAIFTPDPAVSAVTVSARDGVNVTTQVIALGRAAQATSALTLDANVDPRRGFNFVPFEHPDVITRGDDHFLNFHGSFNRVPQLFTVDGEVVTPNPDGSFATEIKLNQGITAVNVRIVDVDGSVFFDSQLKILFDSKVPGFELTSPNVHPDGAIYRTEDTTPLTFAGSVWDNAFGYSLTLNGDVVKDFFEIDDPTPEANKQEFSADVAAKNGDKILFGLYDQAGNAYLQLIPVIIDAIAPELKVDGVTQGEVIEPTRQIAIRAEDVHLQSLEVTLDGKPVTTAVTNYVAAADAETLLRGEPDPGLPVADRAANDAHELTEQPRDAGSPSTGEGYTVLTVTLPTPLAAGHHDLTATATDKAGNRTDTAVSFTVDSAPVIEGPDSITVDPDEDVDQQIRDAYTVFDDLDSDLVVQFDASVLRLDETVKLTLKAIDSAGHVTEREVEVLLQRPLRTLEAERVKMTARFHKDSELTASWSATREGERVGLSSTQGTYVGAVTLTSDREVRSIWVTDEYGNRHQVDFTRNGNQYTFQAPSNATVDLLYADANEPGTPVDPTQPGKPQPTTGPTAPGKGSGGLPVTGAHISALAALTGVFAATGMALMVIRRQAKH